MHSDSETITISSSTGAVETVTITREAAAYGLVHQIHETLRTVLGVVAQHAIDRLREPAPEEATGEADPCTMREVLDRRRVEMEALFGGELQAYRDNSAILAPYYERGQQLIGDNVVAGTPILAALCDEVERLRGGPPAGLPGEIVVTLDDLLAEPYPGWAANRALLRASAAVVAKAVAAAHEECASICDGVQKAADQRHADNADPGEGSDGAREAAELIRALNVKPAAAPTGVHYAPYGQSATGLFDCGASVGGHTAHPDGVTCEACKRKSPGLWPELAATPPG